MDDDAFRILDQWTITPSGADVQRFVHPLSFSGAEIWRVQANGQSYALRAWPIGITADRLRRIHDYQSRLVELGPPVIPALQPTRSGATFVHFQRRLWELATWRPGVADFWQQPSVARLDAAMQTLAAIHEAGEPGPSPDLETRRFVREICDTDPYEIKSTSVRVARLESIVEGELQSAVSNLAGVDPEQAAISQESISLIVKLAPGQLEAARYWKTVNLPIRQRLGDIHHHHVLFTGDKVTGVVDFGAADVDSPAGDVARLLGSLVGDDVDLRRRGLAAYQNAHQLSPDELEAVDYFDSSGTVIAAANWLVWLLGDEGQRISRLNSAAAVERQKQLLSRLRNLAARMA